MTEKRFTVHLGGRWLVMALWVAGCSPSVSPSPTLPPVVAPAVLPSVPAVPSGPGSAIHFHDRTAEWELAFHREDDIGPQHRIVESNGGGVAVLDYDQDGWPDLFLTNGCPLPLARPATRSPDGLFRNVAGEKTNAVGTQAGIAATGYHHGCTVGDWNSDGFPDLYVAALGPNRFYVNDGDGTFTEQAVEMGIEVPVWSSSPAFADLDGDGFLDLYVTNYVMTGDDPPVLCPEPRAPDGRITCPPTMFEGEADRCFRSDGADGVQDVTQQWHLTGDAPKGLGCVIADLDQNGHPDIYVANDGVPNFCFMRKQAGEPFVDEALLRGVALGGSGKAQASMGIAIGDTDRSGWLDFLICNFYAEPNAFYRAMGNGDYEEVIKEVGLSAASTQVLGFGTLFLDPDNDGWLDLFVANGHIDDMRWRVSTLPYKMRPQLFENTRKGTFRDVSASSGDYFQKEWLGRGVASVDLNLDGRVDLVVSHQLDRSSIVMNETPTPGPAISLRCIGTRANRSAISTKLWLETDQGERYHEIVGGSSYNSAPDLRVHFGLGKDVAKAIRVQWLSGTTETIPAPPPGRYTLVEGQGLFVDP